MNLVIREVAYRDLDRIYDWITKTGRKPPNE